MENTEDRYDVARAQTGYQNKKLSLSNKMDKLKRERKQLGASIHSLEKEMPSLKGAFAIERAGKILRTNRSKVKEIETLLDAVSGEYENLQISSFMGSAEPAENRNLKRSEMDDTEKLSFISQNGMDRYKNLNY